MNGKILVSVVSPVWNPGEGIVKCINSLRAQTLKEIEIIFVDDCGSDDSLDHIREAAAADDRVQILRNPENRGPGYSRNRGIETARGEYISFIDPDDFVAPDYLERLYSLAKAKDLDIAKGRIVYLKEDGSVAEHHEQNDSIRAGLKAGKPLYAVFTYEHHSAIYRREMLMSSGARYGLARRAQDITFLLKACHSAKRMDFDDKAEYYFCERGNSAMHTFDIKSLDEKLFSFKEQVDFLSSAVGNDSFAPGYANTLILTNLRFLACHETAPERTDAIAGYLHGMRDQLLRLPFLDKMKRKCYPVAVLAEKGVALPASPCYLPWEKPPFEDWFSLLKLWVEHLREYPREMDKAVSWINSIREKCIKAAGKDCKASALKDINALTGTLPVTLQVKLKIYSVASKIFSTLPGPVKNVVCYPSRGQ